MPLTGNGKIDRRALATRVALRRNEVRRQPKRDSVEEQIAALWCELLDVETVGIDDNFFELGGHSLLVLPLRDRLQQLFDHEISPVDLFRYPTVATLAHHLGDNDQAASLRSRKGRSQASRQQADAHTAPAKERA
jgi:acyl carrier protein